MRKSSYLQNINGTLWDTIECYELDKKQEIYTGKLFTIHPENDTILVDVGETTDNFYSKGRIAKLKRIL